MFDADVLGGFPRIFHRSHGSLVGPYQCSHGCSATMNSPDSIARRATTPRPRPGICTSAFQYKHLSKIWEGWHGCHRLNSANAPFRWWQHIRCPLSGTRMLLLGQASFPWRIQPLAQLKIGRLCPPAVSWSASWSQSFCTLLAPSCKGK